MSEPIAALEAEGMLIGSIFLNTDLLFEAQSSLVAKDFFDANLRRIFVLMGEMIDAGREVDQYAFVQYVTDRKLEGEMLLATALECADKALRVKSAAPLIAEISDKSKLRSLARLGYELSEKAYAKAETADGLLAETEKQLFEISASGPFHQVSLEQLTYDAISQLESERRGESVTSLRTGLPMLDVLTGGLGMGELTIIAGRPSMGKSCMLAQAIITNCMVGNFCHAVSIEMTAGELLKRIWAALSQVPFGRLAAPGFMTDEEFAKVRRASMTVSGWPLLIDDSAAISPDHILANAKLVRRKHDTKLLAVDYLQRISFPGSKKDLFAEVGDAARRFAELAKTEGMAVMLLSSLTEKTGGANVPPSLTDLRNSGDIQYHAHRAYLIHRDRTEGEISPNTVFIVAKNRHGRTGAVDAVFNSNSLLFEDPQGGRHVM